LNASFPVGDATLAIYFRTMNGMAENSRILLAYSPARRNGKNRRSGFDIR
jgi:hypothetical protein